MSDEDNKDVWCPKIAGEFYGYRAEWLDGEKWKSVPFEMAKQGQGINFPYPIIGGSILMSVGLMGKSQALAIAWGYSAMAESRGDDIEVRIMPYDVKYEIKARKTQAD